ncbi:MAG: amidase family protein, partial [Actinomycetota bacterium]
MSVELCDLTGHELAGLLRSGETTAAAIVDSSLQRIGALEDRLHAFLVVTGDLARQRAAEVDGRLQAREEPSLVAGIPLALKDVLCTRGIRTTAGSKILEPYVPPYDCTPWHRLGGAWSILVGKTNCDEFA